MKKHQITWVTWRFGLGTGIQTYADFRDPNMSIVARKVHHISFCTNVHKIIAQRAAQMIVVGEDDVTDAVLETTFLPAKNLGMLFADNKMFWTLQKKESITDGAIRASEHIFKLIKLRAYSLGHIFSGDFSRPLSEWTEKKLRSSFSVHQHTMFEHGGNLEDIEVYLRKKHGLPEVK